MKVGENFKILNWVNYIDLKLCKHLNLTIILETWIFHFITILDLFQKKSLSLNVPIQSPNLLITSILLSAQSINNIFS